MFLFLFLREFWKPCCNHLLYSFQVAAELWIGWVGALNTLDSHQSSADVSDEVPETAAVNVGHVLELVQTVQDDKGTGHGVADKMKSIAARVAVNQGPVDWRKYARAHDADVSDVDTLALF